HRCGEHKQEAQQDHVWFTIPFVRRSAGILNRDTREGSSSRSFLVSNWVLFYRRRRKREPLRWPPGRASSYGPPPFSAAGGRSSRGPRGSSSSSASRSASKKASSAGRGRFLRPGHWMTSESSSGAKASS